MAIQIRHREAVIETIRICKDKNVLKEYLETRESEVISIMMSLFDQEEVFNIYVKNEVADAKQKQAVETAVYLLKNTKLPLQEIANASGLEMKDIENLENDIKNGNEKDVMQLA